MNVKFLCFLVIHTFLSFYSFSQNSITGKISGKLIEEESQNPIPFANVLLYPTNDSIFIAGTTSDLEGNFSFKEIPYGTYDMIVKMVGYEDLKQNIKVESPLLQISPITLNVATELIEEVVITAKKNTIETSAEGIIIQADANLSQEGGTALDLLRNSPSISVDTEGNIALRGSGSINVLVDGRNSALSNDLEQIPASAIENIKIINNPGAKYDAQGVGGIIDIRLKKEDKKDKKGLSGRVKATVGTQQQYNGSLGLTYKGDGWKAFFNYNHRSAYNIRKGDLMRESGDNFENLLVQDTEQTFRRRNDNFKLGTEINLSSKSILGFETVYGFNSFDRGSNISSNSFQSGVLQNQIFQQSDGESSGYNLDNALNFTQTFSNKDHQLKLLASYSFSERDSPQNTRFLDADNDFVIQNQQRINNDVNRSFTVFQVDYTQPFANDFKLETGLKTTNRRIDNQFTLENLDLETENYILNTAASNHFIFDEQVYAGYLIVGFKRNRWEFNAGLRAEQTVIQTELRTTQENNTQDYLNLFPSTQIQYNLNEKQYLRATYSRRIDRPNDRWLNPFRNISDSLNFFEGNANLLPELTNSYELGYTINLDKVTLISTVFYRDIENWYDFVQTREVDENNNEIFVRRPQNIKQRTEYGAEFILTVDFFEWWNLNGSVTLFRAEVDASNLDTDLSNFNNTWNGKLISNFTLPADIDFQITANYEGPEAEAISVDAEQYSVDMGFKKTFLNKKLSLNLNLRDVFNTLQRNETAEGEDFRQTRNRKPNSQIFLVSVGYRF